MNKIQTSLVITSIYILLIALAFFRAINTDGVIGHTWDWGIPLYQNQFRDHFYNKFFVWHNEFETGRYFYFSLEFYYWLILLPFSWIGGEYLSKFVPMALLLVSGIGMYNLARRQLRLSIFFAFLAGMLYMFSPYSYSRIIAGHLPILFGYALLPIYVNTLFNILKWGDDNTSRKLSRIIICGILLGLMSVHPSIGLSAFVISLVCISVVIIKCHMWKALVFRLSIVTLIAVTMNLQWIAPLMNDQLSGGIVRHGWGLSAGVDRQVTNETEMPLRFEYLKSTSQPVGNLMAYRMRMGMDTEFVYPSKNKILSTLQIAASSVLIGLLFFYMLMLRRKENEGSNDVALSFIVILVIGIILCAGYKSVIGVFYLTALQKIAPLFYISMGNAGRWFVLISFGLSVIAPAAFQKFQFNLERRGLYKICAFLIVAASVSPFLSGQLTRDIPSQLNSTQPLNLKITKSNSDDYKLYKFFEKDKDPYRVYYVPAPFLSWPGETEVSLEWMSVFSPKNVFPASHGTQVGKDILENIYAKNPSKYLAEILGLVSVKYVVLPKYEHHYSYYDYRPEIQLPVFDGIKDFKGIFESNFSRQNNFKLIFDTPTIKVYENLKYIPRIYASNESRVILSESVIKYSESKFHQNDVLSLKTSSRTETYKNINFEQLDPTTYVLTIDKPYRNIVFNEAFDKSWTLYKLNAIDDCKNLKEIQLPILNIIFFHRCLEKKGDHFIAHEYANAWILNEEKPSFSSGEKYIIYFDKQLNYSIGIMISILTLTISFIALFVLKIKERINL